MIATKSRIDSIDNNNDNDDNEDNDIEKKDKEQVDWSVDSIALNDFWANQPLPTNWAPQVSVFVICSNLEIITNLL